MRIPEKPEQEFAADKVEQIIVADGSSVSTGAVQLAMEREIDVVYLDWRGKPIGRVYPCKLGGTTLTRRRQLEACLSETGAEIAKKLVQAKIKNQAYFLKALAKSRKNSDLGDKADEMLGISERVESVGSEINAFRETLLGLEGRAGNLYWGSISGILPMEKRDQEGGDIANALLNYGYGILYGEVEKACILSGLDPYLGFFHTDRYGKTSLVLDVIEGFRPVLVDRAVVTLFMRKQIEESDLETKGNSDKRLTKDGREKIIAAVMERLHTKLTLQGEQKTFEDVILRQCRDIARKLLDPSFEFRPFVYKW